MPEYPLVPEYPLAPKVPEYPLVPEVPEYPTGPVGPDPGEATDMTPAAVTEILLPTITEPSEPVVAMGSRYAIR